MGNDPVSSFLESFPTKLECSNYEYFDRRRVFWSHPQSIDSFSNDDNVGVIQDKIKSAFSDTDLSPLIGILQFWAPIKTPDGRRLLSSSRQPFTFAYLNSDRRNYRLTCINYQYSTIKDDDPMIINGPPATAFLNRFPVVFDLTLQQDKDNPLVRSALECELTTSLLIPVFYPSLTSSCVGVVQCCVKSSGLSIFNYFKHALEKVGLTTYHVHESHPCKNICGLGPATNEI